MLDFDSHLIHWKWLQWDRDPATGAVPQGYTGLGQHASYRSGAPFGPSLVNVTLYLGFGVRPEQFWDRQHCRGRNTNSASRRFGYIWPEGIGASSGQAKALSYIIY